ncbi:MAG TPA: hypothetical protein VFV87_01785 [Pirellulaceae bacterium]|nr:hypothetical protein [Pirellulaceae bacterium]
MKSLHALQRSELDYGFCRFVFPVACERGDGVRDEFWPIVKRNVGQCGILIRATLGQLIHNTASETQRIHGRTPRDG